MEGGVFCEGNPPRGGEFGGGADSRGLIGDAGKQSLTGGGELNEGPGAGCLTGSCIEHTRGTIDGKANRGCGEVGRRGRIEDRKTANHLLTEGMGEHSRRREGLTEDD